METVLPADGVRCRRGEVTLEQLHDGTNLLLYTNHGYQAEAGLLIAGDNAAADLFATVLEADGRPLGEERRIVQAPQGAINVMSPALRRLPDGSLGMAYSLRISKTEARRVFLRSTDEGATWDGETVIAQGGYTAGSHDRLTVLTTGRLVAPLHCADDWDTHYRFVRTAISDDIGRTWRCSNDVRLPHVRWDNDTPFLQSGCNEASVVERADGSLRMILRSGMGTIFCCESQDGGLAWGAPHSMEVACPCAPSHLTRIPDTGEYLLVWNSDCNPYEPLGGPRHTLSLAVSAGQGAQWPPERRIVLAQSGERCFDYPAVYYRGREVWVFFRLHNTGRIHVGGVSSALMKIPLDLLPIEED